MRLLSLFAVLLVVRRCNFELSDGDGRAERRGSGILGLAFRSVSTVLGSWMGGTVEGHVGDRPSCGVVSGRGLQMRRVGRRGPAPTAAAADGGAGVERRLELPQLKKTLFVQL